MPHILSNCLLSALLLLAMQAQANAPDTSQCFNNIRQNAAAAGVKTGTINRVLEHAKIEEKIIALDRKQPEFSTTFADYLGKRVNERRIDTGRALLKSHSVLLNRLTRDYGIPGRYLVAFWGLETNFGGYMGKKNAISALATLACDQRRAKFFMSELVTTMKLVERFNLNPEKMESSWAGAMGQTQFMPSTFARYAVDGDGDNKIDLWKSTADALASGANYLQALGWEKERRWGREVLLPAGFDWTQTGRQIKKSLAEWRALNVRTATGQKLPDIEDMHAAVIVPAGHKGPAFIVYENFKVIMGWNRSEYYALSVGLLADRLAGAGELRRAAPSGKGLRRSDVKTIQAALNTLGFESGKPDGIVGAATRKAVRAYQLQQGLIADGFPDSEVLRRLQNLPKA
ncbi:MAG: lytic murein transglycosylase [Pseudomonadales bacterium]